MKCFQLPHNTAKITCQDNKSPLEKLRVLGQVGRGREAVSVAQLPFAGLSCPRGGEGAEQHWQHTALHLLCVTNPHINIPHPSKFPPCPKNTDFLSQEGSEAEPCIFRSESMKKWQLHPRNNPEGFDDPHPKPAFEQEHVPVSPSHKGVTAGTISDSAKGLQEAIGAKGGKQPFPIHAVSLSVLGSVIHRIPPSASPCQPAEASLVLCSLEQALGLHSFL